jgi:hypothetical protein
MFHTSDSAEESRERGLLQRPTRFLKPSRSRLVSARGTSVYLELDIGWEEEMNTAAWRRVPSPNVFDKDLRLGSGLN